MSVMSNLFAVLRSYAVRNASTLAYCGFALFVLGAAAFGARGALAVYLLGFWHYYLYWLAFAFGGAPFAVFKRDAVAAKTVSVAVFATVYLAAPLDVVSLAAVAGGVFLNVRAAAVLGFDRTYYGHEVAGLPPLRVDAFPYSAMAHPMIAGNVLAFGGTLINADFARQWWPLAGLHVALNIGLLAMELAGKSREFFVRLGGYAVAGALAAAAVVFAGGAGMTAWLQLAAAAGCAAILYRFYAGGATAAVTPRRTT
jgi:hypothetical protein